MENAADALKIAFGVFIFIVALAITFSVIAQAKKTADVVMFTTDKTNFYDWMDYTEEKQATASDIIYTLNRIAEGETITVSIKIDGEEIVPKNLGTSEKSIGIFINDFLSGQVTLSNGEIIPIPDTSSIVANDGSMTTVPAVFSEKFVEVHYSGMYKKSEDGSEITISDGGTREYITFTYLPTINK